MMDTSQHSLAVALTYVFQTFGVDLTVDKLVQLVPQGAPWDALPGLTAIETGQYGTYPYNSPSIVRFEDGSSHYVDSPADRTIIDSADGQSKRMEVYGTPQSWATFRHEPDQPLPKPEPMVYIRNDINGIHYEIQKPKAPQKMYVNRTEGIDLMDFSGPIHTPREFLGVPDTHLPYGHEVRIMGTASYPIKGYENELFLVPQEPQNVWGEFTRSGKPAALHGYKASDLSDTPPPEKPPKPKVTISPPALIEHVTAGPTPLVDSKPLTDIQPAKQQPIDPSTYNFKWLRDDHQPVKYKLMYGIKIQDYSGRDKDAILTKAQHPTVDLYGMFWADGEPYLLVTRFGDELFTYWYGIPETIGERRIVEEIPDYTDIKELATTVPERRYPTTPHWSDHLVNWGTILEVTAIRGVYTIKKHVERITSWKQSKKHY